MSGSPTSGNPNPSGGWKRGDTHRRGAIAGRPVKWKEIIANIMDEEPYEVWRDKYGHTWAEAIIRRGNELFMQGKLPNWFISIAQYTQPNQQEVNVNVSNWKNFEGLGISREILIERLKEFAGEYIDGVEVRDITRELEPGRSVDAGSGSVSLARETARQESVVAYVEAENRKRESGV